MAIKNVPPPPGSKPASVYQRFIPREELGDFASWKPGTFGDDVAGAARAPGQSSSAAAAPGAPAAPPNAAEWQARVVAARKGGYQDGYRDGSAGLEGFKQSFSLQTATQIGQLLQAFDQQLDQLDSKIAAALAQTAVQLARQVLRAELQARPELVAQVAGEAVGAVMLSARHISVHVNPLDLPLVAQGAEEVLSARGARLSANAQVARGGVLVQSDVGNIDARIGARWSQAAAALGSMLPLEADDLDDDELPAAGNDASGSA